MGRQWLVRRAGILLFLIWPSVVGARTWYTLPAPVEGVKNVLVTLLDGGDIWVGYEGYGLVRQDFYGTVQKAYTPKNGLPGPTVTDLVKIDDDLWVGTSDGLAYIDQGGTIKVFGAADGLPDNGVTCLAVRDGTLFVGTMKGLARYKGATFDVFTEEKGLPTDHVTSLCSYEGGLIIGTTKGWAIMQGDGFQTHTQLTDPQLPCEWITSVAFYRNQAFSLTESSSSEEWFVLGTAGEGLLKYNSKTYRKMTGEDPGLKAAWITCLAFDAANQKLWVGSKEGIAVQDVINGPWEYVTAQNSGLISDQVNDINLMVIDQPIHDYEPMNASGMPELRGQDCPCATCGTLIASATPAPDKGGCYAPPDRRAPKILHVIQTWAGIGTMEGANVFFEKNLPHRGQGNFYTYLANMGWRVVGVDVGERVFAGVHPPGAATGFLAGFIPPLIRFEFGYPEPSQVRFTNEINILACTHEGRPAVGGYKVGRGGFGILGSGDAGNWLLYGSDEGLADQNVTALYKNQASMLIGTGGVSDGRSDFRDSNLNPGTIGSSGNLYRWREGKIEGFPKTGLPFASLSSMFRSAVTAICADDKKVYVGTNGDGIYIFDGVSWIRKETLGTKALKSDSIQALAVREGILYVGTKKGLDCLGADFALHCDITGFGAYSNQVEALLFDDSEGDESKLVLWVGHYNGILRISTEDGLMVHGGLPRSSGQTSLAWPSRGVLSSKALFGWAWPGNPKEYRPDVCPFDGLPGNHVYGLAYDDLNLWIATDNGLGRLRK